MNYKIITSRGHEFIKDYTLENAINKALEYYNYDLDNLDIIDCLDYDIVDSDYNLIATTSLVKSKTLNIKQVSSLYFLSN